MKSAFIFHGSGGNPEKHWYPWLKTRLTEHNLNVVNPQFPIGDDQSLDNWLKTLEPFKDNLQDSILIGHSLGVPFILNVLNQWDVRIKAAFLVSGFVGHLVAKGEKDLGDFSERAFDWDLIRKRCHKFYVFHSDNDHYIPLERADELAKQLGVDVIFVKGAGHFQAQGGFKTFQLLLNKIENEL